jgi:preprotein translocase subunit SecG
MTAVLIFKILLIICSILLLMVILMQSKGVGLSATFGGDNEIYRSRRGPEKVLFLATVVLGVLWALLALLIPVWPKLFG